MKTLCASLALAVLSLSAAEGRAGGLIQALPEDGTWVRYTFTVEMTPPQELRETGLFTIRSVGVTSANGRKCRWIELDFAFEAEGKMSSNVYKLLVPEDDLRGGRPRRTGIIRGWEKNAEGEISELESWEKSPHGSIFAMLLPATGKDGKRVDKAKTVDYQRGRLECKSAIERTIKIQQPPTAPEDFDSSIVCRFWPHEKVPFGIAAMTGRHTLKRKETVLVSSTMTTLLQDFGTGARSALPDKQ